MAGRAETMAAEFAGAAFGVARLQDEPADAGGPHHYYHVIIIWLWFVFMIIMYIYNIYIYIYICLYIYIYIHIHKYVYMYVCMCVYIYIYICVYIYIYIYIYIYMCTYVQSAGSHSRFQTVWLRQILDFMGWNSWVHREFAGISDSEIRSLRILSLQIDLSTSGVK